MQIKVKNQTLSNGALPAVCPSQETTDRLRRVSLLVDSNLYRRSNDWMQDQETNYLANFLQMVNSKKLCCVNSNKLLNTEEWHSFFQAIKWNT